MADTNERELAEQRYVELAHDYEKNPIGSRDWVIFWNGWRERSEVKATPPADAALADVLKIVESQLGHAADVGATYVAFTRDETIRIAARLRALSQPATVAQVPELYCVGRANYPPRGGNVGINWHVVGVADVPYRTCVPKNGELLFVLAASQSATGGACPDCNGDGQYFYGETDSPVAVQCERCLGTGSLSASQSADVKAGG